MQALGKYSSIRRGRVPLIGRDFAFLHHQVCFLALLSSLEKSGFCTLGKEIINALEYDI